MAHHLIEQEGPISRGKRIKPRATNASESILRGIVLVIALAVLLFPVAAWADTVVLDDGALTLTFGNGSVLREDFVASGPGFTMALRALGGVGPNCENCLPGTFYNTNNDTSSTLTGTAI